MSSITLCSMFILRLLCHTGASYTQSTAGGGIRGFSTEPSATGERMVCCDAESRQIYKVAELVNEVVCLLCYFC